MLRNCTACAGRRTTRLFWLLLGWLIAASVPTSPLAAQAAQAASGELRVSVAEENFRAAPSGVRLAVLVQGARLKGGAVNGQWREATLEAWLPEAALEPTTRDGFTLRVVSGGSPLHREPRGAVIGRASGGFLLHEAGRRDGWVQVRRTAWIWGPSVAAAGTAAPAAPVPADTAAAQAARAPAVPRVLLAAPEGDTVARLRPGTRLDAVGRDGEWVRVRVEGWVHVPEGGELNPTGVLSNVSLRALRDEPDRFRGASVRWQVQFVSVQRADSLRSDLQMNEPYILARDPGGEPGFVYIVVPANLLPQVHTLVPLQKVEIVGRVRTGRSALMGHPVLELLELHR